MTLAHRIIPAEALRFDRSRPLTHDPEPGACGDPACPVLHRDPANPIHPPFYVDSRSRARLSLLPWRKRR